MIPVMKWIDLPPIWLLGFAVLTWASRGVVQSGTPGLVLLGSGLVVAGLITMVLAIWTITQARTTVIPHRQPDALVTSGIFGWSRNPIYLGDAMILAGLSLRWDAPLGLLLVPVFMWVILTRFIRPEEDRLRTAFGTAFTDYASQTRRWI